MLLTRLSWVKQDAAEEFGQGFWSLRLDDPQVREWVLQHFMRRYPRAFARAEVEAALEEASL